MTFATWFATFLQEKGIDLEQTIVVSGPSGENVMPLQCVVDAILAAPRHEQHGIMTMLVKIDFRAGSVVDYLKHLAKAIAQ